MKKFIATLAATALAIAGAVVVAPSASADVRLVPVKGALGFLQVEGAIEEVQMLNELPVDWYGLEFNGVNCQDRLVGKAFPTDTNPADVIRWFRYNRNANDPACDVAFTVVKETTPFPGESWWFGQNFTDSSPERVSYPALPNCAPEATYGDNGEWCFELKYGNTPYLNDRVSTEQPDYTPDYIDECTPPLVEAMADRGLSIKDGVRVSVDFSGIYSGKPFACFVQPQNVIDNSEPQVDADCSADEMVVPTADGNVCFQAPTAVSGGAEDKQFNAKHYDGIVGADWKLFEYCPSVDYIGNWMKLQSGESWSDWYRENLALDNLSTSNDLMDCEDRVIDAVDGDQNFLGLSSFTSFSHTEDFFTAPVDGEPLCTIAPLERNNRHDLHCQTTVRFSQVVTTWVDPNQAPPGFEVEWVPDPNKEISIELPAVPESLDYEFVYEQGEAGVCLYPDEGEVEFVQNGLTFCGTPVDNPVDVEPIQEFQPPPPECWQGPNNCPVGQSISYAVPEYMMVGVPVNVTVYAIRSVEDELGRFNYGQPDNGTAVIHYGDHESDPPVAGVPFENGQATFRVVPQEAGQKNFSICGVLNSGTSGGNAYIECIDGETTVLPYDPEVYRKAFRDLALEKGDKFTIVDRDQAKGKVAKRLEWRVAQSDDDVCAVYETKKGKVRAKFSKTGECTVLWEDPKTGESGRIQIGS